MTPAHEARIWAAVAELADALVAAARADQDAPQPTERLLSIAQASEALGIGRSRLYAELEAGRLRSVKAGRRRLIPASAVAEFVDGGSSPPGAAA